ncbi:GIY-YIG nuclease family protein [Streptomyces sp. S399]|uniref:GIY-YIG nuclease family protein n=1 Tax=Streptomyces sp. S399 TaxID=3096009 RepID=UPI002A7F9836|nr:GIY-YIG nuclease family protein [Streptomyces sp. S399]WPR52815.1 GIY-YIG nuclease family protein [Streptomyces sp. S399]
MTPPLRHPESLHAPPTGTPASASWKETPLPPPCTAVYRVYDEALRLLYVGMTRDVPARLRRHRNQTSWAHMARAVSVDWFSAVGRASRAEYYAIEREGPLYNRDRIECFEGSAQEALQAVPERLPRHEIFWGAAARPAGMPDRLSGRAGWRLHDLSQRSADLWAARVEAENPGLEGVLIAERAGVPEPWGSHAVVVYATLTGLLAPASIQAALGPLAASQPANIPPPL